MRKASEAPFPYGYPGAVCYMEQVGSDIRQIGTRRNEIREAISRARRGTSCILAVWPGQWSSDLFIIDDIEELAERVGMGLS